MESTIAYPGYALWNSQSDEAATVLKNTFLNRRYTFGDIDGRHAATSDENIMSDRRQTVRELYAIQAIAA